MKLGLFFLAAVFADDAAYDDLANKKTKCPDKPSQCSDCDAFDAVSREMNWFVD